MSYFEVDSRIRFLEFSKSYFEVEFQIRLFRFVALFDFSNFDSNLSSKFSLSCSIRLLEFRFEFVAEIFVSNFEFKFLEFSCRISNSPFSFRCSIRLLEFLFEVVVEFDFSNFVSNFVSNFEFVFFVSLLYSISRISIFEFEFVVEIFVALFDFSKAIVKFDFSNFDFSSQVP